MTSTSSSTTAAAPTAPTPNAISFRNWVRADPTSEFPAESGRYHLYVSLACPWAQRTLIYRALKGLEKVIPVHHVQPSMGESAGTRTWLFAKPSDEKQEWFGVRSVDGLYGLTSMKALYEKSNPEFTGRYTVPVLWDSKTEKIVNNESGDIIKIFNDEFNEFAEHPEVNLFPKDQADELTKTSTWIADSITSNLYKCGFATTQAAYEEGYHKLFAALDHADSELLAKRRFFGGQQPNEADILLFVGLIRFDVAYYSRFRVNKKRIADYANLWGWLRDLYQWPGIASTVHIDYIKTAMYTMPQLTPPGTVAIIPLGPEIDFNSPHGREALGK